MNKFKSSTIYRLLKLFFITSFAVSLFLVYELTSSNTYLYLYQIEILYLYVRNFFLLTLVFAIIYKSFNYVVFNISFLDFKDLNFYSRLNDKLKKDFDVLTNIGLKLGALVLVFILISSAYRYLQYNYSQYSESLIQNKTKPIVENFDKYVCELKNKNSKNQSSYYKNINSNLNKLSQFTNINDYKLVLYSNIVNGPTTLEDTYNKQQILNTIKESITTLNNINYTENLENIRITEYSRIFCTGDCSVDSPEEYYNEINRLNSEFKEKSDYLLVITSNSDFKFTCIPNETYSF
jgi:hypothetical protein